VNDTRITAEPSGAPTDAITTAAETPRRLVPPPVPRESGPNTAQWGMISFLISEAAFFSTLITTYVIFMGRSVVEPYPDVLSMPLVIATTICLLSSSATIHMAEKAMHAGNVGGFIRWWGLTILLGVVFLAGTAFEWYELIHKHHLTISRNVFGTTYYTLVGFHGLHVTVGVIIMTIMLGLAMKRQLNTRGNGVQLVSWYWHFVDGVWVVVFTVVYLVGR
jgi:cytochrome c oxidase subunit 3/cytochrome o ubiquinol oxidase subunit 3